jgi:hypothetical protein
MLLENSSHKKTLMLEGFLDNQNPTCRSSKPLIKRGNLVYQIEQKVQEDFDLSFQANEGYYWRHGCLGQSKSLF